jgi:hypothetical protein
MDVMFIRSILHGFIGPMVIIILAHFLPALKVRGLRALLFVTRLIPEKESLTVELKSDRSRLPNRDIVAAVVCFANTGSKI